MKRFKLVSVTVALVALLTAAVAIAKNGNQRHTDPVMAEFTVTQQSVSDRTCTGTDSESRLPRALPGHLNG